MGYILLEDGVSKILLETGGGALQLESGVGPVSISDTGLTISDSLASRRLRNLIATGLSISEALVVALNGNVSVTMSDTGLSLSDSIRPRIARRVIDTGLSLSDSLVAAHGPVRALADTGLTVTDSIRKHVTKRVTDTGLTVTDAVARTHAVAITTTGLTISDSIRKTTRIALADRGMTLTTTLVVSKNGHGASVNVTDNGLNIADSIASTRRFFRSVGIYGPDTGLTITDGIHRGGAPPPTPPVPPTAAAAAAVSGLGVNFTDISATGSAPIASWAWTFGDGGTSTSQNPTHTYASGGTYIVTLTVTTIYGTSSTTRLVTTVGSPITVGTHIEAVIF